MNISAIPSEISGHERLVYFQFRTAYGMAYLSVPIVSSEIASTITIIDCISALKSIESFIRDIEEWFSCGLDVEPVDSSNIDAGHSRIQLKERSSSNVITILIAEEILLKIPAPPAIIIEKYAIETNSKDSSLLLSSLVLEEGEFGNIVNDNIILLSESYNDKWHIKISTQIGNTDCSHHCILDRSLKTIVFGQEINPRNDVVVPLNAKHSINVIAEKVPVPLSYYLGWQNEIAEHILPESLRAYDIYICTRQAVMGQGKLLNIANGFGLYISGLV